MPKADAIVSTLDNDFIRNNDTIARMGMTLDTFRIIPGLVGLWYPGSVQRSSGDMYDLSGQGRLLTYNGNPIFNQLANGVAYCNYDGTGDYHDRADETDLDVLGTETIFNSSIRGLTIGGWFWFDTLVSNATFFGKRGGGSAYFLQYDNTAGTIINYISTDGTALSSASASFSSSGQWHFIIGRFVPSTSIDLWINGSKASNTSSIPASIANTIGSFTIGAYGGGSEPMCGRVSLCFLSANSLPDAMVQALFQQSRLLYGV